jgi:hypothetical protein
MRQVEAFTMWNPLQVGPESLDCYKESPETCLNFANCGLCHQGNRVSCKPGDSMGAFFDETCMGWTHSNYYDRHIFKEKVTTTVPSWSKFYNQDYEIWYPDPQIQGTLQSFNEQATPPC